MIITRTPYRISFFGGGTDYPGWYREHGGCVLGATIDKYCYITCRYLPPFFEHCTRIVYSKIENCHSVDDIEHPSVRECLRFLQIDRGVEIHHDGDIPARSGMGSSSAFTVGLLHALYTLIGRTPSRQQLAEESIHIEQNCIMETVGSQDQVLAAYGGLNHITFRSDDAIGVKPLTIPLRRIDELNSHLMLFYTGIKRTASDIAQSYVQMIECKHKQLRGMQRLVDEGTSVLSSTGDIRAFGELLNDAWTLKRSLSCVVSNPEVDELYDRARAAGAIGGKLTGAGGGGFLLLFVPPEAQVNVRHAFDHLIHVPFDFESFGSQILFVHRQEDFSPVSRTRARQSVDPFKELRVNG